MAEYLRPALFKNIIFFFVSICNFFAMTQKRKELSEVERSQIIGVWRCGTTISTIVEKLNFPKSTIQNVINLYKNAGEIKPSTQNKRPKLIIGR